MHKLLAAAAIIISPAALADADCTSADQSEWQDKEQFQQDLKEQGYKINVFKVTEGNCYEIYGWNDQGEKVEIYFDPVSGEAVKTEVED